MCKAGSIQIESYSLLPKVYRKFMTKFSSKLKPQFQVSFGQDSFPMNTSPFQASLSQNSANCFLLMDGGMPAFTITIFIETFPISSCQSLVWLARYFFFVEQIILVVFPDYFFVNLLPSLQYSFPYTCRWLNLDTSSMISYLIFLNKSFLHLDVASASESIHPMELFVIF